MVSDLSTPRGVPYVALVLGNLHVLRWLRAPGIVEVQNVTREVERFAKSLGGPIICVAIIPAEVEPPSDDARKRMLEDLERLLKVSASVHFVIEGSGFKHVMLRSVVTGLILVAGRRGRIFVHGSFDEVLRECAYVLQLPPATILAGLRARGLLNGAAPSPPVERGA